jgi:mycothiol synthase
MVRIEQRHGLTATERTSIVATIEQVAATDGYRPVSDQLWLDLHDPADGIALFALAHEGDQLIGYAQASAGHGSWTMGVVVAADRNDRTAVTVQLAGTLINMIAHEGGGTTHWWVLGGDPATDAVADQVGLDDVRTLLQMQVRLPLAAGEPIAVRPFVPGHDEDAWLAVNNAAFGWHAEQGGWDLETLEQREREPWFDPDGFLLHERGGRLAGFCWTKVHHETTPVLGEIYVIAVHPDFHGLGLGRALTAVGLQHLADRGIGTGMLYVDGSNSAAVSLYRSMGFDVHRTDRAHVGAVLPVTLPTEPLPTPSRAGDP